MKTNLSDPLELKKKKLCLVIHSLQAGGMERVMAELAGYFCNKVELEVDIVLYGRSPEIFYTIPPSLRIHQPLSGFSDRFRFISTVKRLIYLRNEIKRINPDIILSFGEYWNSFVLLALNGLRYTIYISDRCSPEMHFGTFHTLLRRLFYPRASGMVAQTEKAKEIYLRKSLNKNITVIGNPIHQISNSNISKKEIVLSIGRLIETKNHNKLIELFCDINKKNWKLVIVGGNALRQNNLSQLQELIVSLNAQKNVILTGYSYDLERYYQESSIFAFTSNSEGFPNVIGEAMSAGLPVIAFDCIAGPSEMIIDGQDGFLVPVYDYPLFKERLEQLMEDEPLRLKIGSRGKESVQKFSIDIIGSQYYAFITGR